MRNLSAPSRRTWLLISAMLMVNLFIALNATIRDQQSPPLTKLDTDLEFSFDSSGVSKTVDFTYSWDSSQFNLGTSTDVNSGSFAWSRSESISPLSSTDAISVALNRCFSKASIIQSTFTLHMDESWEVVITLALGSNLDLRLIIDGDNSSVKQIIPILDLALFPTALKDELRQIGLEWLDLSILVGFTVNLKFIEDLIHHFFDNIVQGITWITKQLERLLTVRMIL